ncbi:MAG: anthranilate phosphoribosyltransferase [Elusimicrobiota bacterium]|jgi:anthranilate phosphoribosyltransferase|nr:anthranilate phosphoribosyltransferase [Elusimicrobiota bacterium]
MIREAIHELVAGKHLSLENTKGVMGEILDGQAAPSQIASFLTAMRIKGESINEITACAAVMREKCVKLKYDGDALDIVGTGGDELFTFNISTISAFVCAGAGAAVAKHGNRSVSSKCGSADLLEALDININLDPRQSEDILNKLGVCFMSAVVYHPAMKIVSPVRKDLGIRTVFNIIGPLSNPADAKFQLLGVYNDDLVEPLAKVLSNLGLKRAAVVHGHDGSDEITLTGETRVCETHNGKIKNYFLSPEEFGFKRCSIKELTGGGPQDNAQIALDVLSGKEKGAKRDVVIFNSGVCLYLIKDNITIKEGIEIAQDSIDSGKAFAKLNEFKAMTNAAKRE